VSDHIAGSLMACLRYISTARCYLVHEFSVQICGIGHCSRRTDCQVEACCRIKDRSFGLYFTVGFLFLLMVA